MDTENKKQLVSLDYLRALAVTMILYDHLGGLRNADWIVKKEIDTIVAIPLAIIQDFGAFGVSLFFLISGFLLTYRQKEVYAPVGKTIKKICKIYLTNISAFCWFGIFVFITGKVVVNYWSQFSLKQWILSASLVGYFTGDGDVINGTTWFLVPLFVFYLVAVTFSMIYKKIGIYAYWFVEIEILLILKLVNIFVAPAVTKIIFAFMPVMGMLIGEIFKTTISKDRKHVFLLLGINWISMVLCFKVFAWNYFAESLYLVSFIYALGLLVIFVLLESQFKTNRYISFLCRISLSVYVLQMTFGSYFMQVFEELKIPFTGSFVISVGIILILAWLHYNFIEKKL